MTFSEGRATFRQVNGFFRLHERRNLGLPLQIGTMRQEVNLAVYPPRVENPSMPEAGTGADVAAVAELAGL